MFFVDNPKVLCPRIPAGLIEVEGGVCWLRHFKVEMLFKGLLLYFQLFDERFKVMF